MFVDYVFAKETIDLAMPDGLMYRYVVGANGVFVQARRKGLEACLWSSALMEPIRGLAEVTPYVKLEPGKVNSKVIEWLFWHARNESPKEALFYLVQREGLLKSFGDWTIRMPTQVQSAGGVRPVDPFNQSAQEALIEVHSHHTMGAFFSRTDDRDEQGFRIYAVMGMIFEKPTLLVRAGVYGHFWEVPARWIFDLPGWVRDGLEAEMEVLHDYNICAGE